MFESSGIISILGIFNNVIKGIGIDNLVWKINCSLIILTSDGYWRNGCIHF